MSFNRTHVVAWKIYKYNVLLSQKGGHFFILEFKIIQELKPNTKIPEIIKSYTYITKNGKVKHFGKQMSEYEIVSYLINTNTCLKQTYILYQDILKSIKNKDINLFIKIIESKHNNISEYMIKTLKTYNKFKNYIINSLKYKFNNGIIEGTNNLIKCIKRIAFGYKSFYHFKTRILLITGIYKIA